MKKITLLLILLGFSTFMWSQSDNDTCETAIDLGQLTSPIVGSTFGATDDSSPSCGANTSPDIYYSIVVPSGSTLTINQPNNQYDSRNYVFYGDCDNQNQIACFDDPDAQITVWENTTGEDQTVYWVQDGYGSNSGTFTLAWSVIACTNATINYTVVSDCENGEQFLVNVDITSLGSASSLSVSDDQGSEPQIVTDAATLTFGPYPNTTPIIFTVANNDDADCTVTSQAITQSTCPPNCDNAVIIENCGQAIDAVILAGTGSWNPFSCNFNTPGNELLYSFTPTITGIYSLQVTASGGGYIDYFYKEASGSCDQTDWLCIDDIAFTTTVEIAELQEGVTYLILLDGEGTTAKTATFNIVCAPTCTNATATYTAVGDCTEGNEQFFVSVNVSDMGTAVSLTVTDDQGSEPQVISEVSILTFGPYPNTTPVIFTVSNDDDDSCILTSTAITQSTCPPNCDNAVVIENCGQAIDAVILAGNGSWNPLSCNFNTPGNELLYSFTPTITGFYSLQVTASGNGYIDYFYKEATGSCDETGWICIDDLNFATTVPIAELQEGVTYLILLDGEGTGAKTATFNIVCAPTCTNATASYTAVGDCTEGNEQFFVTVNVSDMGTAVSLTVTDDQGSEPQVIAEVATLTFGPYPNTTPVIFTVSNDDDASCILTSTAITQSTCPPNCDNAVVIENCGQAIDAVILAGNGSWNPFSCNFNTPGNELLYSFTPTITGLYSLQVTASGGGYIDYFYKEASGSCDQTDWLCIGDFAFATTVEIAELQEGVTYLILLDGEGTTAKTATFNIVCAPTCTNAAAFYTTISDCTNGNEQYFIEVNIIDMGSAVSLTITDDQGSEPQVLSDLAMLTFGPYPNATPVIITVADNDDATCVLTSPIQNLSSCPPANDTCEFATPMVITGDFDSSAIVFDNTGATVSPSNPLPSCGATNINTTGKDVWYQSTAPESGNVTVETRGNGGLTDTVITVYAGDCGNLIEAGCDDDTGIGNYSLKVFTGLTPGQPLFIRVWGWNGSEGSALLGCYDAALLNTDSLDLANFKYYPNPIKDVLNLSYSQNIENITVFNLLGQQVITKTVNATQSKIDMSHLASGTYVLKVTIDGLLKTIKVVKE